MKGAKVNERPNYGCLEKVDVKLLDQFKKMKKKEERRKKKGRVRFGGTAYQT